MKVLIIEDDSYKANCIEKLLSENHSNGRGFIIERVETMSDASQRVATRKYDAIVLDLMLPYIQGGEKSSQAGYELARQIRGRENVNSGATVVGLSAYPDEVKAHRARFDELGVLLFSYDDEGVWEKALSRTLADVSSRLKERIPLDFLIICALDKERDAYEETEFKTVSESIVGGLNARFVQPTSRPDAFGALIRLSNMGLVVATRETAAALNLFDAQVVAMSGICAGFSNEAELGHLIVASPAWEYQAGKWSENDFEIGAIQVSMRPSTRALIDQTIGGEGFLQRIENNMPRQIDRPKKAVKAKLAPFVTGSAVVADKERLSHIEKQHRKIAALDMEVYGLYFSAYEAVDPVEHFFAVKCVVDFADDAKDDSLHSYGCIASARSVETIVLRLLAGV